MSLPISTRDLFQLFMRTVLGTLGDLSPLGTAIASAFSAIVPTIAAVATSLRRAPGFETVRRKGKTNPTKVVIGATGTTRCSPLAAGDYYLEGDADCYWTQAAGSAQASSSTRFLRAGYEIVITVEAADAGVADQIAALQKTSSDAGTLWITPVEAC